MTRELFVLLLLTFIDIECHGVIFNLNNINDDIDKELQELKNKTLKLENYFDMEDCDETAQKATHEKITKAACMFACKSKLDDKLTVKLSSIAIGQNMTNAVLKYTKHNIFDTLEAKPCSSHIRGRLPRLSICLKLQAHCLYRFCLNAFIWPDKYQRFFFEDYVVLTTKNDDAGQRMDPIYQTVHSDQIPKVAARMLSNFIGPNTSAVLFSISNEFDESNYAWCNDLFDHMILNKSNKTRMVRVISTLKRWSGHIIGSINQFRGTNRVVVVCGYRPLFLQWLYATVKYVEEILYHLQIVFIDADYGGDLPAKLEYSPPNTGMWKESLTFDNVYIFRISTPYTCRKHKDVEDDDFVCPILAENVERLMPEKMKFYHQTIVLRHRIMQFGERLYFFRRLLNTLPTSKSYQELEKKLRKMLTTVAEQLSLEDMLHVDVYNLNAENGLWPVRMDLLCSMKNTGDADRCQLTDILPVDDSVFVITEFKIPDWVLYSTATFTLVISSFVLYKIYKQRRQQNAMSVSEIEFNFISSYLVEYQYFDVLPVDEDGKMMLENSNDPDWIDLQVVLNNSRYLQSKLHQYCNAGSAKRMRGYLNGIPVTMRSYRIRDVVMEKNLIRKLRDIRAGTDHENVFRLVGYIKDAALYTLIFECGNRGTLADLLSPGEYNWDYPFKLLILHDIAEGMKFIHGSSLGYHGSLSTSMCYLDHHIRIKISVTDFLHLGRYFPVMSHLQQTDPLRQLWIAPEILRHGIARVALEKADIYSFSIILQEVVYQMGPFHVPKEWMEEIPSTFKTDPICEIVNRVKIGTKPDPFRPYCDQLDSQNRQLVELMIRCWHEMPNERPTFYYISDIINKEIESRNCKMFIFCLRMRNEMLTTRLHQMAEYQLIAMREELFNVKAFLYQLFPHDLAGKMISANSIPPKVYTSSSIYFSDIVGFTEISSINEPEDICKMLDILFCGYDHVLSFYHIFPVTRIGDAYVLASGLGGKMQPTVYAEEMAMAAIQLVHLVDCLHFSFLRGPKKRLRIRTGIATGDCVGGVIGEIDKTPQFMLVGQLVTLAQSMEASSEPMRILIEQETCKLIIDNTSLFSITPHMELRFEDGIVVNSFWLESAKWPIGLNERLDGKLVNELFKHRNSLPIELLHDRELRDYI